MLNLQASVFGSVQHAPPENGPFDRDLRWIYQSDADFEKSVWLWSLFDLPERTMCEHDLTRVRALLPAVPAAKLRTIRTKCNRTCFCGRVPTAFDLISFSLSASIHGARFLSAIFTEERQDHKVSIMDSVHRRPELPDSVLYLDDTKPIPCSQCGSEIHLYLLHTSIAHYWH
jgi:hypothetical protein